MVWFSQAALAFDVIQQHETTKQLEHATRHAAYEMPAHKYDMERFKDEGDAARRTLAASISVSRAFLCSCQDCVHNRHRQSMQIAKQSMPTT